MRRAPAASRSPRDPERDERPVRGDGEYHRDPSETRSPAWDARQGQRHAEQPQHGTGREADPADRHQRSERVREERGAEVEARDGRERVNTFAAEAGKPRDGPKRAGEKRQRRGVERKGAGGRECCQVERRNDDRVPGHDGPRQRGLDGGRTGIHRGMAFEKPVATRAPRPQVAQQRTTYGTITVATAPPEPIPCNSLSPIPVRTATQTTAMKTPQPGSARSTRGANPYAQAASVARKPRFDCPSTSPTPWVTKALTYRKASITSGVKIAMPTKTPGPDLCERSRYRARAGGSSAVFPSILPICSRWAARNRCSTNCPTTAKALAVRTANPTCAALRSTRADAKSREGSNSACVTVLAHALGNPSSPRRSHGVPRGPDGSSGGRVCGTAGRTPGVTSGTTSGLPQTGQTCRPGRSVLNVFRQLGQRASTRSSSTLPWGLAARCPRKGFPFAGQMPT